MEKIKLGVIFGGMSTENEVSCISGLSVIRALDKDKYDIFPIYIDKSGNWFEVLNIKNHKKKGEELEDKRPIDNIMKFLKSFDVVFPVLHGLYGEDGTIQGIFEMLKVPYVGCGVLASSVAMDKVYSKIVFERAGFNQAKYVYIRSFGDEYIYVDEQFNEYAFHLDDVVNLIAKKLEFPMFVKPSNSGSSVGINKVVDKEFLKEAIVEAARFDKKILIEEGIIGREVECAVLGNEHVITSCIGEVKAADDFYSYDAKYNNEDSKTLIPAIVSEDKLKEIQSLAVKAFKCIDGKGLSRVDFFIESGTERVFINEINTLPGFTGISMYPKLFECSGLKYGDLLDKLVELANL